MNLGGHIGIIPRDAHFRRSWNLRAVIVKSSELSSLRNTISIHLISLAFAKSLILSAIRHIR